MLVATIVKLPMERLARLNGAYDGKGSGRSPVQSDAMGGVVNQLIVSQHSSHRTRVLEVSLLHRHVALF